MRAAASGRIVVGVAYVTVTLVVHVSECASSAAESPFISLFLLLVSGHPAFPDGTVEGPHVRLPPGGLAPVVAHAADLNRIGIMYL